MAELLKCEKRRGLSIVELRVAPCGFCTARDAPPKRSTPFLVDFASGVGGATLKALRRQNSRAIQSSDDTASD